MKLIRFGNRGINLALVRSWTTRQVEDGTTGDTGAFVPNGTFYDSIYIEYTDGGNEIFDHEEATILRQWLEANAEDISQEPPTAEIGPSPMEGYRG